MPLPSHPRTTNPASPARRLPLAAALASLLFACTERVQHTALGSAAAAGDLEAVEALLEHAGADPDAIAGAGWAPLHLASRHADRGILDALVEAGANIELRDRRNGWTPLLHAIHVRNEPAVAALIGAGANANRPGESGITPLIMASGYGMADTVRLLLDAGADPRAEMGGLNALWAAAGGGAINDFTDGPPLGECFPEIIEILQARAPDLKVGSGVRSRILTWLANDGCEPLVAELVSESRVMDCP